MQEEISIDLETYSSVDLKKCGMYAYVESGDFEIMLLAYKRNDEPTQLIDFMDPNKNDAEIKAIKIILTDPKILKRSYNAAFEMCCLKKYFCPNLDPSQWRCTMVEAAMLGLPLGLGQVADVLKLPVQKYNGFAMIKYFCCPVKPTAANNMRTRNRYFDDPAKWNEFKEYCKIDVNVEYAVKQKIKFFQVCPFERPVYAIDQVINSLGVRIDRQLVENCIRISTEYTGKLKQEAISITGLKNPNSVKQLAEWLSEEMEEDIPNLQKATIPKLLEKTDSAIVKRILNIRQRTSKGSVKKYQTMLNTECADGRIRGLFQYYGGGTIARFAGRGVQVHNLPRNYMKNLDLARQLVLDGDIDQLEMFYGPSLMKVISQLIRTAFIPAPGKTFKVSDFSAIEARVIAWLAGEKWKLDVFNTHGKIYEATGARMFNMLMEDIKKGSSERDAAKITELACGFGGSIGALTQMIIQEETRAYEQGKKWTFYPTEEQKQIFVNLWRAANPKIRQYWYDTDNAAITAVLEPGSVVKCGYVSYHMAKNVLFCTLPSGRQLAYMRPRITEGKYGGKQIEYEGLNQTSKKWERTRVYGGLWVQNQTQAIARDLLVAKIKDFYVLGADMPLHIHDEIVIEDDSMFTMDEINEVMGRPVKWAPGLPLRGDGFETNYYLKGD